MRCRQRSKWQRVESQQAGGYHGGYHFGEVSEVDFRKKAIQRQSYLELFAIQACWQTVPEFNLRPEFL